MTVFPCKLRIVTDIIKAAGGMDLAECIDTSLHLAAMIAKAEVGRDEENAPKLLAGLHALYDRRDVLEARKVERCGPPQTAPEVSPLVDADDAAEHPAAGPPGDFATLDAIGLARSRGLNLATLGIKGRTITRQDVDRHLSHQVMETAKKKGAA